MQFRPTVNKIIEEYSMEGLLLPKNGGLQERVATDINLRDYKGLQESCRAEDIPRLCQDLYDARGARMLGITGDDLYDEYCLRNPSTTVRVLETIDWYDPAAMFLRPALCLLRKEGNGEQARSVAVNAKYAKTSENFLGELGLQPIIRIYNGDTERTVAQGINDACIDVVYSGSTLKQYNLEVWERVRFTDLVAIGICR